MSTQRKALSEVADVNPRIPSSIAADVNRQVDFVPMAHLSEGGFVSPNGSRALSEVQKGYTYFENGDVIVAKITPCMENGKAAFVDNLPHGIAFGSTEFHVLRPNKGVFGKYLFYSVWNPQFRHSAANNMTGSAGQKRVPTTFFDQFSIPLPPLSKQKRIADILDKANGIRRKRQEAKTTLSLLASSLFLQRFGDPVENRKGWEVVPMETLFAISPNYGTMIVPSDLERGWLDLRVANIQDGVLDLTTRKYVDLPEDMIARHEVQKGDLLLARAIGSLEHLGKCIVADPGNDRWAFDSHLMRVRFDTTKVEPLYIHAFLSSPGGRHEFLSNSRRSAVQYNINTKEMAQIRVPLPPLSLQKDFVRDLNRVDELSQQVQTFADAANDLFNALTDRAFRGEL